MPFPPSPPKKTPPAIYPKKNDFTDVIAEEFPAEVHVRVAADHNELDATLKVTNVNDEQLDYRAHIGKVWLHEHLTTSPIGARI